MMEENLPKDMGIIPIEEFIKHLEDSCPERYSCDRLSQLIMDDKTLIEFRRNICYTKKYKNCGEELSKLFGWENDKDKYLKAIGTK